MIIDPQNMSLRDWADSVILNTNNAWSFGKLDDEARWQDWATGFVRAASFAPNNIPDPYQFEDWRAWAERAAPLLEVG